jgi:hypothetical protein
MHSGMGGKNQLKTVAEFMAERGNTSGFDYLRLLLAVSVLCIHSFATSYGRPSEANAIWRSSY